MGCVSETSGSSDGFSCTHVLNSEPLGPAGELFEVGALPFSSTQLFYVLRLVLTLDEAYSARNV